MIVIKKCSEGRYELKYPRAYSSTAVVPTERLAYITGEMYIKERYGREPIVNIKIPFTNITIMW